jgi:hypothetical protein
MFVGGGRQLLCGLLILCLAILRCVRFAVGGALCLVGFVGGCCGALGLRIAHPEDRKLLQKL